MDSKALSSVEIKDADKGQVTAVFSTYDVVDKDGDVTVKSAIKDGTAVRISAYNHGSWQGALPVGKGVIRNVGNQAVLEGQFFMNTTHGRDTFEVVKQLADQQEWSYGFDVVDFDQPDEEAKSSGAKRVLKQLNVHEVSPVMIGAGVGTRTLGVKGSDHTCKRGQALPEEGCNMPWVHSGGKAYDKPKPDEDDKKKKHNHAEDEKCTDECPAFEKPKPKKMSEHGAEVLASVVEFRERAAEVMAMRAQKGQGLGEESRDLMAQIQEELGRLKELLKPAPEEKQVSDAQREWLRSIANNI